MCDKTYFIYVTWLVLLLKFQCTVVGLSELQIFLDSLADMLYGRCAALLGYRVRYNCCVHSHYVPAIRRHVLPLSSRLGI